MHDCRRQFSASRLELERRPARPTREFRVATPVATIEMTAAACFRDTETSE